MPWERLRCLFYKERFDVTGFPFRISTSRHTSYLCSSMHTVPMMNGVGARKGLIGTLQLRPVIRIKERLVKESDARLRSGDRCEEPRAGLIGDRSIGPASQRVRDRIYNSSEQRMFGPST